MTLKGLPSRYKTFAAIVTQKDRQQTFTEFKVALRSFEETERCQQDPSHSEHSVMNVRQRDNRNSNRGRNRPWYITQVTCYKCGKPGHKSYECKTQPKKTRWCDNCRSSTHDTTYCRRKDNARTCSNDNVVENEHSFAFKVGIDVCNNVVRKHSLLVDCGATTHIISDQSKFVNFDDSFNPDNHLIELADGSRTNGIASGRGNASVVLYDVNGTSHDIILENALYVPSYDQDIFSVQAATDKGATVMFTPDCAKLKAHNGTAFNIEKDGRLYFLNNTVPSNTSSRTVEEWHKVLGQCNVKDVLKLENVVNGMKITNKNVFDCDACIIGKMSQYRSRKPDKRATRPLEFVHCDLAGPVTPVAKDGFKYAISFVDDYSGAIFVYFLKNKSDTVAATEVFLADSSRFCEIKRLRSDNGTEFTSDKFKSLMVKKQICHETSAPYSPHQNGTAERSWRSLFEMARCLLLDSKLPKSLWTYAVMASAYIRNRCYNPRTGKTPYELLTGVRPNCMYLVPSVMPIHNTKQS